MNRAYIVLATLGALALTAHSGSAHAQDGVLPAKSPGVVRIGLVKPSVQMGSGESTQASDAVRSLLAEYLSGPTMEVALLNSRLPSQFAEEARQADCDFTMSSTLVHRPGGQSVALGRALGTLAGQVPYAGAGGNVVQSVVVSSLLTTAADFASNVKAKDEMRLEYRLATTGAAKPLLKKTAKARASADGEDLLTPLVEKAAEAVGAAIEQRRVQ
jgi:hypothetical protein